MTSLKDYCILTLLESLTSADIIKDFRIEECSQKEIEDIFDTDDFDLSEMAEDEIYSLDEMCGFNISKHYKMIFRNTVVGVFGLLNIMKLYKKYCDDDMDDLHEQVLFSCFILLIYDVIFNLSKDEKLFDDISSFKNGDDVKNIVNGKRFLYDDLMYISKGKGFSSKKLNEFFSDVANNTMYISYLNISKKLKNKLDISNIAIFNIFKKSLYKTLKENNIKAIFAHGKGQKTSMLYRKVLGCHTPKDLLNKKYFNHNKLCQNIYVLNVLEHLEYIFTTLVYRKI